MTESNEAVPRTGSRGRRTVLALAGMTAAIGTVLVVSSMSSGAVATPDASVTLCHATGSTTHPYQIITVNADSIQTKIFGPNGHGSHTGPVFDPAGGKNQPAWGDIIPSFVYVQAGSNQEITYPGLNVPAGQAILDAGCVVVAPQPSGSTTPTPTPTPSASISGTNASTPPPPPTSTSAIVIVPTSAGPIPGGVSAGLHTPLSGAGLRAWGTILMLLGGAVGLLAGVWPTRRRAH